MIYLRLKGFIRIFYKKSKNCHRSQNLKGALSWVFGNAIEIAVEETTNSTFLVCAWTAGPWQPLLQRFVHIAR